MKNKFVFCDFFFELVIERANETEFIRPPSRRHLKGTCGRSLSVEWDLARHFDVSEGVIRRSARHPGACRPTADRGQPQRQRRHCSLAPVSSLTFSSTTSSRHRPLRATNPALGGLPISGETSLQDTRIYSCETLSLEDATITSSLIAQDQIVRDSRYRSRLQGLECGQQLAARVLDRV